MTRYFISQWITPVLFYEPQVLALTPFFDDALETPPVNTAAYMPGPVELGWHLLPQYFEDTLVSPTFQTFRWPCMHGAEVTNFRRKRLGRKFPSIEGRQSKYMTSLAFHTVFT